MSPAATPTANNLARAVAKYHAGCLRVIGAQNVALRDVRTTRKAAICCDVGVLADAEEVLSRRTTVLSAPVDPGPEPGEDRAAEHHRKLIVWERLRELAAKVAIESHAREVVYGGPLLSGYLTKARAGKAKAEPVLAPLLMQGVTLRVTDEGQIVVTATDEPPRFNTAVWGEAVNAGDVAQIVGLGIDAQADLAAGFDPERVHRLLMAIASVFPAVEPAEPSETLEPWPALASARETREESELTLHDGAVLFLANRASPYLLHDLETIADEPEAVLRDDRPLSVLLRPPATKQGPELGALNLEEVVYPFPSNAAQRQVVDALSKNRIVVVQGPPGNGKSLTIANLVAHLVAHGQSVLVASHKQQALTVVKDKLEATNQRFLFASLIGDGAPAKRELQRQIADVKAFAGAANRTTLERQQTEIEQRRTKSGARYRALREEFITRAEPEQEEAAELFETFRGVATLPTEDPELPAYAQSTAAQALRRLDELSRAHAAVWARLRASRVARHVDLTASVQTLNAFIDCQDARVTAGTNEHVDALVRAWHPITDAEPMQIDAARRAIADIRAALAPALAVSNPFGRAAAFSLADAPPLLADAERGIVALEAAFAAARELAEHRDAVSAPVERRAQILQQHALLGSLVKRRGARKWLDEHAPGSAAVEPAVVECWSNFWGSWSKVCTLADGLAGGLRTELPTTFSPDEAQALVGRGQRVIAHAKAILVAREAALTTRVLLPLDDALAADSVAALETVLTPWTQALAAADADRLGNTIKVSAELAFLDGAAAAADDLLDRGQYAAAAEPLEGLRAVLAALPALAERRELLNGPLAQLSTAAEEIEAASEVGMPAPGFLAEAERALAVHGSVRRFDAIASSETTRELAEQLSELTEQVMEDARRLLGGKIQGRILEGFRKPSFLSSLEAFRKAIGASPKRFERFEELKNSPQFDIDVLTDVFPCWIMRPEDACRVFPMRPDVFDVVIFDEASQCNPDQVLPLFARASRALIVGDDKQLSNEDLRRSLASNANQALLRQAGLEELDPSGLFDQTQHSLLELASRRQQAAILLNEHFRCRPEIVAFSNDRFYGGTLRIIRDREDDHGLGPALIIREVHCAGEAAVRGAKINHAEARALVEDLRQRLDDPRYEGMTFGVLSLFREQTERLEYEIERTIPAEQRNRHRLICSTVDGFQGDERDVILYSWRYTRADHPAVFAFTNGGAGEQRTNVALTRARHQAIHFVSVAVEDFPMSAANVSTYLRHCADPQVLLTAAEARAHREPAGAARRELAAALHDGALGVAEDYVACGVSVDLLVRDDPAAKRVAVFVDANRAQHRPADTPERVDQHALLKRAGWTVVRVAASQSLPAISGSVRAIRSALSTSPSLRVAATEEAARSEIAVAADALDQLAGNAVFDLNIAVEDHADYHWEVATVEARLAGGEDVFQSAFECDLYTALARVDGLQVVPQWPSRGKSIDLVVTDRTGRRLAVEADGAQHHETETGELIPEDVDRQALLEAAGWSFCRVRHSDFAHDPEHELNRILDRLADQPPNEELAARVWEARSVEEALAAPPEPLLVASNGAEPGAVGTRPGSAAGGSSPPPHEIATQTEQAEVVPVQPEPAHLAPDQVMPSVASFENETPVAVNGPEEAAEEVPAATTRRTLDDLPLGEIAMQIAGLVHRLGRVQKDELVQTYADHYDIDVPRSRERRLNRFAWSAWGHNYIEPDGHTWIPGSHAASADVRYGAWTFRGIVDRARQLLVNDDDPFDDLIHEVYAGNHIPKLAMSLVGSAIKEARSTS